MDTVSSSKWKDRRNTECSGIKSINSNAQVITDKICNKVENEALSTWYLGSYKSAF